MSALPSRTVADHGRWLMRDDAAGVTHLVWQWDGGPTTAYLCCSQELWDSVLETVLDVRLTFPMPQHPVSCIGCLGHRLAVR